MQLAERFDRWIFDAFTVTPEGLGLYRIFYAAFMLLLLTPGNSSLVHFAGGAALPAVFYHPPPGPMMLFADFPPPIVVHAIGLLLNVCLVALLVGYRARVASVATGVLLLVGYGFSFSVGKINHVMLFILLPLVMSASNWGAAYSLDARADRGNREVHAWPLTMMALLVGFAMFTAGFSKLMGGWLDPMTQASQHHFIKHFFVRGRQDLLAPIFAAVDHPLFWETLDIATVLFEVGFLAAAFHPAATRLFAACAVFFHFSTMVMLNISFAIHLVVYAAFINWWRVDQTFRLNPTPVFDWMDGHRLLTLVFGTGVAGLLYALGSPVMALNGWLPLSSDLTTVEVLMVSAAVLAVLLHVVRRLLTHHVAPVRQLKNP